MVRLFLVCVSLLVATAAFAQEPNEVAEAPASADSARLEATHADSVVSWIARRLTPLRSVVAGSGFEDLQPLKDALRDVRVVGLGEGTHGTREFFQFKHRLFEFLVREMGVRVLAFEGSQSAAEHVVDPYVQGGPGEVDQVVASLGLVGAWEEVRALVTWMRDYNQGVADSARVRFVGMDVQYNDDARRVVLDRLGRFAPERVAETEALFRIPVDSLVYVPFLFQDSLAARSAVEESTPALEGYRDLYDFVADNYDELSARGDASKADELLRHARLLAQFADVYGRLATRPDSANLLRDQYMADNVERLLDESPDRTPIAVWAQNLHVMADSSVWNPYPLGRHLRDGLGDGYYALATALEGGSFVACDIRPESVPRLPLAEFEVGPRPEGTAGWYFSRAGEQAGAPRFFLDLRDAPDAGPVAAWLREPLGLFWVGSMYSPEWGAAYASYPTRLGVLFDGVAFLGATSAARPLPYGDCPDQIYR